MHIVAVVLAAGLGKRMNTSIPKVLNLIHGKPMLQHVLDVLKGLGPQKVLVIVGKNSDKIRKHITDTEKILFVLQKKARGTADAMKKALPYLTEFRKTVLVVNGDTPLITKETIRNFLVLHKKKKNSLSVLSFLSSEPFSYGRILRDSSGNIIRIIEEKDTTSEQKEIKEVNSGIYAIEHNALELINKIKINKSKGEYYLTDIVYLAKEKGLKIDAFSIASEDELTGVNTPNELERARKTLKERIVKKFRDRGVNFIDSGAVYISTDANIGKGTTIYPNVYIEGTSRIGKECIIYPNVRIIDSIIHDYVIIKDSTLIENSIIMERASVGPFSHLRPQSEIGMDVRIGNFVEVKKSKIGSGTKALHLTYLGDSVIGKNVNIGAGTITCNYDGYKKYVTNIEDKVFIGSDSQLIAPVRIGKGAYVGAGTTVTKDVPQKALAISRVGQKNIEGWALRRKSKIQSSKLKVKKSEKR
ncbi:MAG: bifunctional UDP-N-acetylglucosamine diphosphorylase/glucosamine-1-phosphate N-acetyltransferase GlmU [Nitrospirae bacterium]|nr:bifunctional UDP-N-acetylglucosamine diphosphorylase/glucosamine-1-phosphate N-acetyltransferase GlmU [Nitrospirota bacterium]